MLQTFWEVLTLVLVKANSQFQTHSKPCAEDVVQVISIGERYPGLQDCAIIVSRDTPVSERMPPTKLVVLRLVLWLKKKFQLAKTYTEPFALASHSFPNRHRAVAAVPWRPEACDAENLAEIVFRGPFSHYTRRREDGDYEIDLSALEDIPTQKAFLSTGGRMVVGREEDSFYVKYLEGWGERHTPTDDGFELARKRFVAGLNTYNTFVDHLIGGHLIVTGTMAVVTVAVLPAHHPLRQLIHPFTIETMKVNNYNVDGLIKHEGSNVPTYSGYGLQTLYELMTQATSDFDLSKLDPEKLAETNGIGRDEAFVTLQSCREVWQILRDYTTKYCARFISNLDFETRIWVETLDSDLPGGVCSYLGIDSLEEVNSGHIARLVAVLAYTASVHHYLVGTLTRNYYLYPRDFPTVVPVDGGLPPAGIVMEKSNSIAIAGIQRYRLVDDSMRFEDPAAQTLLEECQQNLKSYWTNVEKTHDDRRYHVNPNELMSSIHA